MTEVETWDHKYGVRLKGLGVMILMIMVWIIFHPFFATCVPLHMTNVIYQSNIFLNMKDIW